MLVVNERRGARPRRVCAFAPFNVGGRAHKQNKKRRKIFQHEKNVYDQVTPNPTHSSHMYTTMVLFIPSAAPPLLTDASHQNAFISMAYLLNVLATKHIYLTLSYIHVPIYKVYIYVYVYKDILLLPL